MEYVCTKCGVWIPEGSGGTYRILHAGGDIEIFYNTLAPVEPRMVRLRRIFLSDFRFQTVPDLIPPKKECLCAKCTAIDQDETEKEIDRLALRGMMFMIFTIFGLSLLTVFIVWVVTLPWFPREPLFGACLTFFLLWILPNW
jgi:hypothetical protein